MPGYLLSHAVTVLAALASILAAFGLAGSRRTSQSMIAWLLAIAFLPFIAIPLFLLLGRRKFTGTAKGPTADGATDAQAAEYGADTPDIARVLHETGVAPPRPGNSFELLATGEVAFPRLIALIAAATRSIDLTMFILGNDATGHAVVDALVARAQEGVSVRVILDGVGSAPSIRYATTALTQAGAQLRVFMPLMHSPIRGRTNLRSHRKLGVFDREYVFAGGMNLAVEYMGPSPIPAGQEPRWRDVASISSGPVAVDAEAMFESDWAYCGGAVRSPEREGPLPKEIRGDAIVQVVPSGPDFATDTVYDLFLGAIFAARSRVTLVTPYYVPDDVLQHALVLAARRGVRTEVIVPTKSNHVVADVARRSLLRELTEENVRVRYYPKGMVHAKAMVVDDAFAYVGSPNFDMRSLFLNYENALCVYSSSAIAQVRAYLDELGAECDDVGPPGKAHPIREEIARFLAPEL